MPTALACQSDVPDTTSLGASFDQENTLDLDIWYSFWPNIHTWVTGIISLIWGVTLQCGCWKSFFIVRYNSELSLTRRFCCSNKKFQFIKFKHDKMIAKAVQCPLSPSICQFVISCILWFELFNVSQIVMSVTKNYLRCPSPHVTVQIRADLPNNNVVREYHLLRWGRDKDDEGQNNKNIILISRLHIDGVCCGGTTGPLDHKGGVGGDGKGHHRHPWQLDCPGGPLLAIESNITLARLPGKNCKPVTSLSTAVFAAEEM